MIPTGRLEKIEATSMLGAIAGDIIGSIYEHRPIKTTRFPLFHPLCRFTDDTVLTVALADSILHDTPYVDLLKRYYRAYPRAGYGGSFHQWAQSERSDPYNSWGNGSAMRVSPVGLAYPTQEDVLEQAKKSAEVTHDHPEGIKGAQAVASAVFLARTGKTKEQIKSKALRGQAMIIVVADATGSVVEVSTARGVNLGEFLRDLGWEGCRGSGGRRFLSCGGSVW
jgi:ADP-ribosylglycohydrolase